MSVAFPTGRSPRASLLLAALLFAPLAACSSGGGGGSSGAAGQCVDFESLSVPFTYQVGNSFTDSGTTVQVKAFQWSNGTMTPTGFARTSGNQKAGGSGKDMEANNVNLAFLFGRTGGITLKFGEYGGNLNLKVNSEFRNFANFADIDGQTIGGATASVTNGMGNDRGTLELTGIVEIFEIGGQELWVDDVCPVPAP